jgi:hypothetical protein
LHGAAVGVQNSQSTFDNTGFQIVPDYRLHGGISVQF